MPKGKVVATSDVRPTLAQLETVLPRFTGEIEQVPPAYSALKIDGKPAYERRERASGRDEAATGHVIHDLELRHLARSAATAETREKLTEITLSATVSKGTYIRSLARDIAHALGTVGHVTQLRRTRAGPFTLDPAISLDFLKEPLRRAH